MSGSGSGASSAIASDAGSINRYAIASYVPRHIFSSSLVREGLEVREERITAGILFMDVSGFTKLSESLQSMGNLGIEALSTHLNSYFGTLIDAIDEYGGDVIKIAGDALIVMWKISQDSSSRDSSIRADRYTHFDMPSAIQKMIDCSVKCIRRNQTYKVSLQSRDSSGLKFTRTRSLAHSPSAQQNEGKLKIHCAIACGVVSAYHCGGFEDNWEFLLCNKPIFDELKTTLAAAEPGEIALGSSATALFDTSRELHDVTLQVMETGNGICKVSLADMSVNPQSVPLAITEESFHAESTESPSSESNPQGSSFSRLRTWVDRRNHGVRSLANLLGYTQSIPRAALVSGQAGCLAEMRRCSILFISLLGINFESGCVQQLHDSIFIIQKVILQSEGFIRQYIMDDKGCVAIAAYGLPGMSHEDDPRRCVQAAVQINKDLDAIGIQSSMGVTTGKVYCGEVGSRIRREYAVVGDTVNTAAHMMASKRGILCDDATFRATNGQFSFVRAEGVKLKGKAAGLPIYQLSQNGHEDSFKAMSNQKEELSIKSSSDATEFLDAHSKSALIGRDSETELIDSFILSMHDINTGNSNSVGKICRITGDAGVGKTAMVSYVKQMSRGLHQNVAVVRASQGSEEILFSVWRDCFMIIAPTLGAGTPEARKKFFEELLISASKSDSSSEIHSEGKESDNFSAFLPLFADIFDFPCPETPATISMSKSQRQNCVSRVLQSYFRLCSKQSFVVIIEQCQYMDDASWKMLAEIVDEIPNICLFITHRSEFTDTVDGKVLRFSKQSKLVTIKLGPLDKMNSIQLLCHTLQVIRVPSSLSNFIFERSQGVPLLVEEMGRYMLSKQVISISEDLMVTINQDIETVPLPDSVEGLIVQRIDELDSMSSLVLKVASVIGMSFSLHQLQAIFPLRKQLAMIENCLAACVRKELLLITSKSKLIYSYKLEVVRQVSYDMLLQRQRKKLHQMMAIVLEKEPGKEISSKAAILAYHYERAELFSRCIYFCGLAAQRAYDYSGYDDCSKYLSKAFMHSQLKDITIGDLTSAQWGAMMADSSIQTQDYETAEGEYQNLLSELKIDMESELSSMNTTLFFHRLRDLWCFSGGKQSNAKSSAKYAEEGKAKSSMHQTSGCGSTSRLSGKLAILQMNEDWGDDFMENKACDAVDPVKHVGDDGDPKAFSLLASTCFVKLAQLAIYASDIRKALFYGLRALQLSNVQPLSLENVQAGSLLSVVYALEVKSAQAINQAISILETISSSEFKAAEKRSTSLIYSNIALCHLMVGKIGSAKGYYTTGLLRLTDAKSTLQHEWITNVCMILLSTADVPGSLRYWKQLNKDMQSKGDSQLAFLLYMVDALLYFRAGTGNPDTIAKHFKTLNEHLQSDEKHKLERDIVSAMIAGFQADTAKIEQASATLAKYGPISPLQVIAEAFCVFFNPAHHGQ
eukprot:TRINITY_DN1625_c0_g1_i5.p1 TRINITY_DN1625_c0_g1~~TRINITY_DN1625_c0_g1_i5.p1  ORF type:complete len:1439 (+),score=295.00 TRINITY_DN1625_c0_g1_i5:101-4417(+)